MNPKEQQTVLPVVAWEWKLDGGVEWLPCSQEWAEQVGHPSKVVRCLCDHAAAEARIAALEAKLLAVLTALELPNPEQAAMQDARTLALIAAAVADQAKSAAALEADARRYHVLRDDEGIAQEVVIAAFGGDTDDTTDWSKSLDEWCDASARAATRSAQQPAAQAPQEPTP